MPTPFAVVHDGRRVEVRFDDVKDPDRRVRDIRVRLFVDDAEVDAVSLLTLRSVLVLRHQGLEVRVRLSAGATRVKRAELVPPGGDPVPLAEVVRPVDPADASDEPPDQAETAEQRRVRLAKRWCLAAFGLLVAYGFALRPLRPLMLSSPFLLSAVTGSRTAVVVLGAFAAAGRIDVWWPGLVLATVSVVKFDPVFWWAGRLWGDRVVDLLRGNSRRSGRFATRAFELVSRWRATAIVATWFVPVVPQPVVYAAAGASGMRLRSFLLVDLIGAFVTRCVYFWLGYRLGRPVLDALDAIDDYALWLTFALLAGTIAAAVLRSVRHRDRRSEELAPESDESENDEPERDESEKDGVASVETARDGSARVES
ncbi:MAG: DedA family protein [Phycicoccus sp.]